MKFPTPHTLITTLRSRFPRRPVVAPEPLSQSPPSVHPVISPDDGATIPYGTAMMTAEDGRTLLVTETERSLIAIFVTGAVIIRRGEQANPVVRSILLRAALRGRTLNPIRFADAPSLDRYYAASARVDPLVDDLDTMAAMQQRLVGMLRRAVDAGSSELEIRAARGHAAVYHCLADGWTLPVEHLEKDVAEMLMQAAWGMGSGNVGTYNPRARQGRRIYFADGRWNRLRPPPDLQSVRLAYASLPDGREMTARLQNLPGGQILAFAEQGFDDHQIVTLQSLYQRSSGLVLFAGPPGSGKNFAMTRFIIDRCESRGQRDKVITIEDPCELDIPNASQRELGHFDDPILREREYLAELESALRAMPTVIMPSEIRNAAAVAMLVQAIRLGLLVPTTLHARDAIENIRRLDGLGLKGDDLLDSTILVGLIGQRLLPTLCRHCRTPLRTAHGPEADALRRRLDTLFATPPLGLPPLPADPFEVIFLPGTDPDCPECRARLRGTYPGIKGKTAVAEVIQTNPAFLDAYSRGGPHAARTHWLTTMRGQTMEGHAIAKMLAGTLAPAAIERAFGPLDALGHAYAPSLAAG